MMIKQSNLLKWAQNNRFSKGSNRNWIHAPDALQRGHMAYLVKFLGYVEVDQPKGIDVVKESIRKLKFNQQLKRAEGTKMPKIELTISVDGVAIQEPKSKNILHQYPLHRISYCADDKSDKKFFSFIAKEADSDKHACFVFVSDKLAEEITLTIGQAFDLAYRRFLETSGRDIEIRKQMLLLQKKIEDLEGENAILKQRIVTLESLKDRHDIDTFKKENNISDLYVVNGNGTVSSTNSNNPKSPMKEAVLMPGLIQPPPPVPPRSHEKKDNLLMSSSQELIKEVSLQQMPTVGTRLENLAIDEFDDFDPRGTEHSNGVTNLLTVYPQNLANGVQTTPVSSGSNKGGKDLFGAEPFNPSVKNSENPFGMDDFVKSSPNMEPKETDAVLLDKSFTEMLDGFCRGLSFGNDDFSLESLDPLHKSS